MTGSSRPFARGDEVIVSRPGRAQQRGVVEVVYPATRDMDRRAFVRFRDEAGNTWGETIAYRHLYQP